MSERAGHLVAVASGKGGVGKTWLAITLAHALAQAARRTLLVDCDLGLANVDIQLGLVPNADLGAVVAGKVTLAAAVTRHDAGFDLIAGRSGSVGLVEADAAALSGLLHGVRAIAGAYDVVLLDLAAGVERAGRRLAASSQTLLVVATDDPTSLTDAYAVLKLYARDRGASGVAGAKVVVNQATNLTAGRRTYATLAKACEAFLGAAPALAGIVRRDDHVRAAIRRQIPLLQHSPGCLAAQDVVALIGAL